MIMKNQEFNFLKKKIKLFAEKQYGQMEMLKEDEARINEFKNNFKNIYLYFIV